MALCDESIIRDNLKSKLHLIEEGLRYIDDEFYLRNTAGASGFIDIFAEDKIGNFVIIELKRSDAASREAITELVKYMALLKRAKNVKNSEIRIIVISTHWHELLVPYSEFYHETNYQLEGYQLSVDKNCMPYAVDKIEPLAQQTGRKICRRHSVYYYKNDEDLLLAKNKILSEAQRLEIYDFIIGSFILKFKDPFYGATKVLYWAQQLNSFDFYKSRLEKCLDGERFAEILSYVSELDDEDAIDELADALAGEIDVCHEYFEIGYPEKLVNYLGDAWDFKEFFKYGVFEKDERLTDALILMDLKGLTGASFVHFFASTNSENRSKLEEIKVNIGNCLYHNEYWRYKIIDILELFTKKKSATLTMSIYNTDDILETIWKCKAENPVLWTPSFFIVIDSNDNSEPVEVFSGMITWNPISFKVTKIITEIFGDFSSYLFERHFGAQKENNSKLMELFGLAYVVDYTTLTSDGTSSILENIVIKGKVIDSKKHTPTKSFIDFLKNSELEKIVAQFDDSNIGGIFMM